MPRTLTSSWLLPLAAGILLVAQPAAAAHGTFRQEGKAPKQEQAAKKHRDPRFWEAKRLMKDMDSKASEKLFRAVVQDDPKNGDALHYLGYVLHQQGRLKEALVIHLRAANIDGAQQGISFYNAACASALLGNSDDAFKYLALSSAHGFNVPKLVKTDADLISLRDDPRLNAFLPGAPDSRPIFEDEVEVLYHLMGEAKGNAFGWAGRNVGDCNGDGVNDMLIAAPFYAVKDSRSPAGRIYVHSGKDGSLIFQRTGKPGWRLGMSADAAGDVNNDGFNDVIVGADGNSREAGRAFVFSGRTGEILHRFSEGTGDDQFGRRVAGCGDIDDDGFDDLIIGAPAHCSAENGYGFVYIYSGKDASLLHTLKGEDVGDGFGGSLCGRVIRKQVLIAVGASAAGPQRRGRAFVYEIKRGKVNKLAQLDADSHGAQMAETYLSFVGDVDQDGQVDLFTSDWKNRAKGPSTGRAYVFSPKTGEVVMTFSGEHRGDTFGAGPGRAGDVNGDGFADLIIGAWRNSEGGLDAGKCTIFSGASAEPLREITCKVPYSAFGYDATGMGDLDGDGTGEFLITAAYADFNGKNSGSAFVIKGLQWQTVQADQLPAQEPAQEPTGEADQGE